jgi:hypothetical protein
LMWAILHDHGSQSIVQTDHWYDAIFAEGLLRG